MIAVENIEWQQVKIDWVKKYPDKHPVVLQYLYQQGVGIEQVESLYQFDYENDLHDPFLLPDMKIAVERILLAIKNNAKILIFGDYDADGLPAVTIFDTFFKQIKFTNYSIVIPDRNREGFGLKPDRIHQAIAVEVDLMITVDCGSASIDALELAREKGLDVIVTDHHEVPDLSVNAAPVALVNPMAPGSAYPFPSICGSAIAFKVVQAIISTVKDDNNEEWPTINDLGVGWEKWLLDLVAIATVGDMMPLQNENRTMVYFGLQVLNKTKNYGLRALIDSAGLQRGQVTETDIAYRLAPRLNAASRVGKVETALDLLTVTDPLMATNLASQLEDLNKERKKILTQMVKVAHKKLGPADKYDRTILSVGDAGWLPGMCGLLASRLVEEYKVSAFVWGRGPSDLIKGSCRAAGGDNVYEIMNHIYPEVFTSFGGHVGAGGFVIEPSAIYELQSGLENAGQVISAEEKLEDKKQEHILEVDLVDVDQELLSAIEGIAPFGYGFPQPLLSMICQPTIQSFGKNNEHLKLLITPNISGVMWQSSLEGLAVESGGKMKVVGELAYDSYTRGPRLTVTSLTAIK